MDTGPIRTKPARPDKLPRDAVRKLNAGFAQDWKRWVRGNSGPKYNGICQDQEHLKKLAINASQFVDLVEQLKFV